MWQKKLDDLNTGDKLEIDCGDTLVVGRYVQMCKSESGTWMVEVRRKNLVERVATKEIKGLRVTG